MLKWNRMDQDTREDVAILLVLGSVASFMFGAAAIFPAWVSIPLLIAAVACAGLAVRTLFGTATGLTVFLMLAAVTLGSVASFPGHWTDGPAVLDFAPAGAGTAVDAAPGNSPAAGMECGRLKGPGIPDGAVLCVS